MQVNLIDVPEKATSSLTEEGISYSGCCQKLIDGYLLSFSSFTHIFDINLVQKKLDSVVLNKVIAEDNIECACTNVDISLRKFLTLMVTNCTTERSFSQMKRIKKQNRTTMRQERLESLARLMIVNKKCRRKLFNM